MDQFNQKVLGQNHNLNDDDKKHLRYKMMSIILSHRSGNNGENDLYITEIKKENAELLDFKTIRDPQYDYNSTTQAAFIE